MKHLIQWLHLACLGIVFHSVHVGLSAAETIFRHAGFEQLSTGELGNAGQNLYVSRRGELKLINWFDFDRDGFPEFVINNDHSPFENSDSLIYFQHPVEGFRSLLPTLSDEGGVFQRLAWMRAAEDRVQFLPSMGGGRSLIEDLNGDGRPEIIFANFIHGSTHDHFPVFVYWATDNGYSANRRSEFPSETASGVAVADLNGDGRPELVVSNMGKEDDIVFASRDPLLTAPLPPLDGATARSRIYWQAEDGFKADRLSELPTRYAVDVKVADLDRDGFAELIFLQGGDWPSVRVFSGDEDGYSVERMWERPVEGRGFLSGYAGALAVGDFDGDERPDLAIAAGGDQLELLLNGGPDLEAWRNSSLPAHTPLSVIAEDLNRDGRVDLAVTGFRAEGSADSLTEAYIYWNSDSGFSAGSATALPVMGGTSVCAGDVNQDGFIDLAFSNSRDNESYDVASYLYWGSAQGFAAARRVELMSFGAASMAIGDLNHDKLPDLFIANRSSGRSGGAIDSFLFWGNPDRAYNRTTLTKVELTTGFSSSAGDLFDEGQTAIAFTENRGVAVARLAEDRSIEEIKRWSLPSRGFSTTLADLDKDGRLDLIVGMIESQGRNLAILRGSRGGICSSRILPAGVADYCHGYSGSGRRRPARPDSGRTGGLDFLPLERPRGATARPCQAHSFRPPDPEADGSRSGRGRLARCDRDSLPGDDRPPQRHRLGYLLESGGPLSFRRPHSATYLRRALGFGGRHPRAG